MVARHLNLGHHCGYLQIPENHPWHGQDYDDIEADVHGGLTYAEFQKDGTFYVGFDCAHAGDLVPGMSTPWYYTPDHDMTPKAFRDLDYVVNELRLLAEQAVEAQ